jgi:hypothetical protein
MKFLLVNMKRAITAAAAATTTTTTSGVTSNSSRVANDVDVDDDDGDSGSHNNNNNNNNETENTTTNNNNNTSQHRNNDDGCRLLLHLIQSVPITTWAEIVSYLFLSEGRQLYQTCHHLWNISSVLESYRYRIDIGTNDVTNHAHHIELRYLMYYPIYCHFNNLTALNLSNLATNQILFTLQNQLPNLQEIYMIGSGKDGTAYDSRSENDLSDIGLLSLMMIDHPIPTLQVPFSTQQIRSIPLHQVRCRTLRCIDITECSCISFYATILLREQLTHPDLIIRRIPQWMEGHYDTMYPNDGIHTYYADGTFLYDRASSNCGYVCDIWKWPSQPVSSPQQQPISSSTNTTTSTTTGNTAPVAATNPAPSSRSDNDRAAYGDFLRFINCEIPLYMPWPHIFTDLFYPGVTLSRFDNSNQTGNDSSTNATNNTNDDSVIVVQNLDGIVLPIQSYRDPIFQNAPESILQPGISMYRDADGNLLSTNTNDEAVYRVTRMCKFPIDDERYYNISSKSNITDPELQQSSYTQRNIHMPPDHIITAIQHYEDERKIDNIIIGGSHNPYWLDDRGLMAAVTHLNDGLFRNPPIMEELPEQYRRLIRRQKRLFYQ